MAIEVIEHEIIDTDIRILKETSCPSLSFRSTLTYQIGRTPEKDLLIRIEKNSGKGIFSQEWIRLNTIIGTLKDSKDPFCWDVLCPLFDRQSVNTAGFMMAALKHQRLIHPSEGRYEFNGSEETQNLLNTLQKAKPKRRPKNGVPQQ